MKKIFFVLIIFSIVFSVYPQKKSSSVSFNGSLETTFTGTYSKTYKDTDYGEFNWGLKNLANLRFKADIGDYFTFGFSINIHTLSGSYTEVINNIANSESTYKMPITYQYFYKTFFKYPFVYKNTYIGGFELERLYFKGGNDYFDIQTGLLRIARGYGYSFSPTDLFNPRNPLDIEARPEGKLSFISTFYPMDMWKLEAFAVLPDDPVSSKGWGFKFGTATKFSVKKVNFEFLYSLFMPEVDYLNRDGYSLPASTNDDFTHIAGFSLKADIEIGLFVDAIYRFDQMAFRTGKYYGKDFKGYEGLEAAMGIDYTVTFLGGNIYFLLEYMFYGSGMIDWDKKDLDDLYISNAGVKKWDTLDPYDRYNLYDTSKKQLTYSRHDYLFGMVKVKVNDYVSLSTAYLFGADDQSALMTNSIAIDAVQSFTINISALTPFDWKMLNKDWAAGEFGATNLGFYQMYKITAKIKF
jgi:hypothetical protein